MPVDINIRIHFNEKKEDKFYLDYVLINTPTI